MAGILLGTLLTRITFKDCFGGPGGGNPPTIQRLRRRCSRALWSAKGMAEHKRRHGHPLQPKMFSSRDALPYHWNPTSMAERVGLPPCNGSTTLNNLPHRFFCATYSLTQSASSALEKERRHQAQSARERRHVAASVPATNANFQCPVCSRLCKSRIGLQSHSRIHR